MANIKLAIKRNVPQYVCDSCSHCNSILGQSLCSTKHRGCCWYSPKFTLYEIHKMTKDEEGLKLLNKIRRMPESEIFNYYIHVKADFDKISYDKYMKNHKTILNEENVEDSSVFFKKCQFVKNDVGCTIPAQYRSYICNLFVCKEITGELETNEEFNIYLKERENYIRWIEWENNELQMMFSEENLNLIDNFDEIIKILRDMPLENYECINLHPIEGQAILKKGA